MTTRILEVGFEPVGGRAVDAQLEFEFIEDKVIFTCDIDADNDPDIIQDIRRPFSAEHHAAFDVVLCSHVLEHIEYNDILHSIYHLLQCLKIGGQIMLVVPSLEWASRRVLNEKLLPATFAVIYGCQGDEYDYHRSGFTAQYLHELADKFGLEPMFEETCRFNILHTAIIDGREEKSIIPSEQHVYIGRKVAEVELITDAEE